MDGAAWWATVHGGCKDSDTTERIHSLSESMESKGQRGFGVGSFVFLQSVSSREGDGTPLQYSCLEKSHGQRSLVGCSPWGHQESDTTE